MAETEPKDLVWIGSSRKDMLALPLSVRRGFGYALYAAQVGEKPPEAKPLRGFGGAAVLELAENYRGDTYRAVYTVGFTGKICVLHVFQKQAKHGISTPKKEIDLIRDRLELAERLFDRENKEA
jgi:phage-related protein